MSGAKSEVAGQTYEAFGRGDIEAVLGAFADDVAFHAAESLPWGGLHHGRNDVATEHNQGVRPNTKEQDDAKRSG